MGQRSQIYVSWQNDKGENILVARYFQWNYAERMVSRARGLIEQLEYSLNFTYLWSDEGFKEKISKIAEVNFDMRDIVKSCDIVKEYEEYVDDKTETTFKGYVFEAQDNNDGQLYIQIVKGKIKYGFLKYTELGKVMDCEEYMNWDYPNWKHDLEGQLYQTCYENFDYIRKTAKLMTRKEIEAFRNAIYDYPKF